MFVNMSIMENVHLISRTLLNSGLNVKNPGLEVIKLEYILRLKIKHNDWLLADTCPQSANHSPFFESENVLKLYNLEARNSSPFHFI